MPRTRIIVFLLSLMITLPACISLMDAAKDGETNTVRTLLAKQAKQEALQQMELVKQAEEEALRQKELAEAARREALRVKGLAEAAKSPEIQVAKSYSVDAEKIKPSPSALTPSPKRQYESIKISGERWAVIIGISSYQDTRIPALRYASADARSFYDWATSPDGGKYAPAMVKLLVDNDATGRNIKDALFTWLKQAIEEDMIVIYFAGHGSPESPDSDNLFLLPYDVQYDKIATSGFPMWDIETALKRFIKAKKVVVIADACHAGGVGQAYDVARRGDRGIEVNPISSGLQNFVQSR